MAVKSPQRSEDLQRTARAEGNAQLKNYSGSMFRP